jgi:hypothetical protein
LKKYAHRAPVVGVSEAMNGCRYYHISYGIVSIIYFCPEIEISHRYIPHKELQFPYPTKPEPLYLNALLAAHLSL